MAQLLISEAARQAGVRPSAIRYYEHMGILPAPRRVSGQRRYDAATVQRLAVLRRAQEAGFTLQEIRALFFGFPPGAPISKRWRQMAGRKLVELDVRIKELRGMKVLLERLQSGCRCETVEACGAAILRGRRSRETSQPC